MKPRADSGCWGHFVFSVSTHNARGKLRLCGVRCIVCTWMTARYIVEDLSRQSGWSATLRSNMYWKYCQFNRKQETIATTFMLIMISTVRHEAHVGVATASFDTDEILYSRGRISLCHENLLCHYCTNRIWHCALRMITPQSCVRSKVLSDCRSTNMLLLNHPGKHVDSTDDVHQKIDKQYWYGTMKISL